MSCGACARRDHTCLTGRTPATRRKIAPMDPATAEALRLLDEIVRTVPAHEPVTLTDDHLRLIERIEALPENQDGADKTANFAAARKLLDFHRNARRV